MRKALIYAVIGYVIFSTCHGFAEEAGGLEAILKAQASENQGCSEQRPCKMAFVESSEGYLLMVIQALVVENGEPRYPPSATYYLFDQAGELIKIMPTP